MTTWTPAEIKDLRAQNDRLLAALEAVDKWLTTTGAKGLQANIILTQTRAAIKAAKGETK